MRWTRRLTFFGAPTWTTRSTSPQSMPRSSEPVATMARELARDHRRLDLCARLAGERAVVERDRQRLVVLRPEVLEEELGLGAGVDEDERGGGAADQVHHRGRGVGGGLAGPGRRLLGLEDRDVGLGAGVGEEDLRARRRGRRRARAGSSTVAERPTRRRPGARVCRRARPSISWSPRFDLGERVDLVDDRRGRRRRRCAAPPRRRASARATRAWSAGCAAGRRAGGRARAAPVSPVRSSTRIARPISASGAPRLRRMSAASAFSGET